MNNYGNQELDFLYEAKNSEKCLDNFRRLSPHIADYIYAPTVYWTLSTSRLLTMEFMDCAEITDVNAILGLGIKPIDVSNLVSFHGIQVWLFLFIGPFSLAIDD